MPQRVPRRPNPRSWTSSAASASASRTWKRQLPMLRETSGTMSPSCRTGERMAWSARASALSISSARYTFQAPRSGEFCDLFVGGDLVHARRDRCKHLNADVLRIFCSKCFSSLAMLPKVGKEVHVCAGSLEAESLPPVHSFLPWHKEEAPPFLGFAKQAVAARGELKVQGGCSCGSCRFVLTRFPEEFQHCYCSRTFGSRAATSRCRSALDRQ
eukprot:s515_g24.t1